MNALTEKIESLAEDIAQQEIDIGLRKRKRSPWSAPSELVHRYG